LDGWRVKWLCGEKNAFHFETIQPFNHKTIQLRQCSSGVEHFHGKEGVGGSIPFIGSAHGQLLKYFVGPQFQTVQIFPTP
jgi:hypothetical protein